MHSVVIHECNFVAPDDDMVHTQNIENTWMRAKRKLKRQFGTSRALFHTYLDEFMWRCSVESKNYFGKMLANITESPMNCHNYYRHFQTIFLLLLVFRHFQPFLRTISFSMLFSLLNALLLMISFICLS